MAGKSKIVNTHTLVASYLGSQMRKERRNVRPEGVPLRVWYCPQITSWSLRGVTSLVQCGGVRSMQVDGRLPTGQRQGDVVIHSLTANIGQFGLHSNSLVHFFLWGANVFTLGSKEHYFRSRNLALPQDSHSLRWSTCDLWTVRNNCSALRSFRPVAHRTVTSAMANVYLANWTPARATLTQSDKPSDNHKGSSQDNLRW
jgi:hypothetical protein